MKFIHRAFLLVMLGCAAVWIWAAAMHAYHVRVDRAEQRVIAEREAAAARRFADEMRKSQEDFKQNKMTPLPKWESPSLDDLNYSVIRARETYHYMIISGNAQIGFLGTTFLWMIVAMSQTAWRHKRWEAPEREAMPGAGKLVGDLVMSGKELTAKSEEDNYTVVQIDGRRAVVSFRNLVFIHSFVGNPRQTLVELPFSEILSVRRDFQKGRSYLTVRTTAGRVTFSDDLQPFQTLADVLTDIAELNRTTPDTYRTALAREPAIRTPWYGWLILLAAFVTVALLGWKFMYSS